MMKIFKIFSFLSVSCFFTSILLAINRIEPHPILYVGGIGFIMISVWGLNKDKKKKE